LTATLTPSLLQGGDRGGGGKQGFHVDLQAQGRQACQRRIFTTLMIDVTLRCDSASEKWKEKEMKVKRTVSITSNQYNIPQFVVKLQE
jgi:hypothetical protein